jgi:hypothetical protein
MMRDAAAWAALLPVAMVGTERHAAPLPRWPGAVGAAIAALAEVDRGGDGGPDRAAADVLRAAGILAVCGLAGAQPLARTRGAHDAAAQDVQPLVDDPALVRAFTWALRGGPERLKHDFLLRFAQAGLRLPHALLPVALEQARQSLSLRALLQPLLGERGVWLARQREDWQFAAGVVAADDHDPRQWSEGTLDQRKAFLASERVRDARAARERLAAALPELPARERAELARGLAVGLASADEPLLDQFRLDRAQEVRAVALELLLRLPEAAHPRRAGERLAALMSRGSILTGRRWSIEPPAQAADDWKADQVEATVGIAGMGQRAWWLYQLARQVPLGWWTTHLGLDARQVAAWADGSDWAEPLWLAWRDVLVRAPDRAWAEALLDEWPKTAAPRRLLADRELVLGMVSPEARERHFEGQLQSAEAPLTAQIQALVAACEPGQTLSPRLSALVLQRVRQALAADVPAGASFHHPILQEQEAVGRCLPLLCCVLPLPQLADVDDWPAPSLPTPTAERTRQDSRQVVLARRALASLPS